MNRNLCFARHYLRDADFTNKTRALGFLIAYGNVTAIPGYGAAHGRIREHVTVLFFVTIVGGSGPR